MNKLIRTKIMLDEEPFHQKMLRMNYDIPLGETYKCIKICFDAVGADENIYCTPDIYEYSSDCIDEIKVFDRDTFFDAVFMYALPIALKYPGAKTGIFDKSLKWYIRLFVDDPENVSGDDLLSANFELYTSDNYIEAAKSKIERQIEGHLILEGAKKYLEQIGEY